MRIIHRAMEARRGGALLKFGSTGPVADQVQFRVAVNLPHEVERIDQIAEPLAFFKSADADASPGDRSDLHGRRRNLDRVGQALNPPARHADVEQLAFDGAAQGDEALALAQDAPGALHEALLAAQSPRLKAARRGDLRRKRMRIGIAPGIALRRDLEDRGDAPPPTTLNHRRREGIDGVNMQHRRPGHSPIDGARRSAAQRPRDAMHCNFPRLMTKQPGVRRVGDDRCRGPGPGLRRGEQLRLPLISSDPGGERHDVGDLNRHRTDSTMNPCRDDRPRSTRHDRRPPHPAEVHVSQSESQPERGVVSSAIRSAGETLHWLGRRFGRAGRGHVTRRVWEIWREGGASLVRDYLLSEQAAARRETRYAAWRREIEPGRLAAEAVTDELTARGPRFSIVVPVFNTPPPMLRACIESVLAQTYAKWTLLLIDDASARAGTAAVLDQCARRDDRVVMIRRPVRGGIAAATNDGLRAAEGEFIALLDHDDQLSPHALAAMARRLIEQPDADVLYSDEDKIDEQGRRHTPVFKPAFSPHHLLTSNYLCHLLVVRSELMRSVGGERSAYNGAQDYDLVLRCAEQARRIAHVPLVLYHWRTHAQSTSGAGRAKPWAAEAGRQALHDAMQRRRIEASVEHSPFLLSYRVRPKVTCDDQVDVVRTRGDGSLDLKALRLNESGGASRWVLVLSPEIARVGPHDTRRLIEAAKAPDAGPVGGVVVAGQGRIDDAGWFVDECGMLRGRYRGADAAEPGVGWSLRLPRNVSIVGPQCLLVERSVLLRTLESGLREPWWIALARAMRAEGRIAQVVGDVQVKRRGGLSAPPARRVSAWRDGLLSEHLAWVEPAYAPPADAGSSEAPMGESEGQEASCAASPA